MKRSSGRGSRGRGGWGRDSQNLHCLRRSRIESWLHRNKKRFLTRTVVNLEVQRKNRVPGSANHGDILARSYAGEHELAGGVSGHAKKLVAIFGKDSNGC